MSKSSSERYNSNPTLFPKTALTKDIVKYLYYMQGCTLQEIGDIFGVSRERVRQRMDEWGLRRFTKRGGRR